MTDPMTDRPALDTAALRRALDQRADVLRQDLRRNDAKLADELGDPQAVRDRGEESAQAAQTGVDNAERERDLTELTQVEAALQRIEAGRYGSCHDCGEAIAPARLAAQPWASRCLPCQARAEEQAGRAAG